MPRVVLIHWNAGEAEERAGRLRRAGHRADIFADRSAEGYRALRESPPDLFVIDLSRTPSHGGALGTWLRQQKATRRIPILFAGGNPEKVARVRRLLPDAIYTEWSRIRGAMRRALQSRPKAPVVPGTMDGYSATPLPRKLGIREGSSVALLRAPKGFERTLGTLPDDVRLRGEARGRADVILLFARSLADLRSRFPAAARALAERGGLWILWPKKASGVATDLTASGVRAFGLGAGFVDYKICAVDATWSGLLFARRRPARRPRRS